MAAAGHAGNNCRLHLIATAPIAATSTGATGELTCDTATCCRGGRTRLANSGWRSATVLFAAMESWRLWPRRRVGFTGGKAAPSTPRLQPSSTAEVLGSLMLSLLLDNPVRQP